MAPLAEALLTVIIYLVVLFAMVVPLALWYAYALSYLWVWFVVPIFGLPAVSVVHMWGLMIFLSLVKFNSTDAVVAPDKHWEKLGYAVVAPAFSLGIGWVVKNYFW